MKNSKKIFLLGGILPFCISAFSSNKASIKPNVIFILVDDLGKEWIPQFGAENIQLPNLQKLSQESTLFDRAYSMPQSTPSRIALLTGQYPYDNGWVNHYDVPRWGYGAHYDITENPCFPKLIQKNGYKTCIAGKWQLNDFRLEPNAMTDIGFDDYCMWTGAEGGNEKISESRYWDPYIHTKDGSKQYKGKFGPDIYSDFIVDFIKKNKENPMFVYYPMTLTHAPFVNTPHDMDAKTVYERHVAMVKYTDYIVGKIIKSVEDNGIADNTFIIFTTDNGTAGGVIGKRNGHYVSGGKTLLSENGINCPLMVHKPGQTSSINSNALIDFTDMFPTFLELTGTKYTQNYKLDGHSFVSLLNKSKNNSIRKWALSMGSHPAKISEDKRVVNQVPFRDRVIIGTKYKIYLTQQRTIDRIYDMLNDPFESKNLVNDIIVNKNVSKELGGVISNLPKKDANPKYETLKHNIAFDFDLNGANSKSNNKVKQNYAPEVTEKDYENFIHNNNNKKR